MSETLNNQQYGDGSQQQSQPQGSDFSAGQQMGGEKPPRVMSSWEWVNACPLGEYDPYGDD